MLISNERFEKGDTFDTFRERILANDGIMRDLLIASENALAKETLDVGAFNKLQKPVRAYVLSEDWCGDCTDNVPILNRVATDSGKVVVKIVSRDENLDVMDQFLKQGKFQSVPLVLFLDEEGDVIGHFIERPDSVTDLRAAKRQELYDQHPEYGTPGDYTTVTEEVRAEIQKALLAMRESTRPWAIQEVVKSFSAIVNGAK